MQIDNCPLVLRSSWRNEKGDDYKKDLVYFTMTRKIS